jgi:hypothetical protein
MTFYIGIDQSLTGTGMCILNEDGSVRDTLLIKPKKIHGLGIRRLAYIMREIVGYMGSVAGRILTTREEYSFSSKGRAVFNLGELGGCVDLTLYNHENVQWDSHAHFRLPASTHKMFCLQDGSAKKGSTKAQKQVYLDKVAQKTGERFDDDNIADSYMLATTLRAFDRCLRDEEFFGALCPTKRTALVPPKTRKAMKVTPSKLLKMQHASFCELMEQCFKETYMVFSKPEGNPE